MLFVLCGVDAVGKTSICEAMNRKGFTTTCRDIAGSPAKIIDDMTLELPFSDKRAALRDSLPKQVNGVDCRYIVITASADTITKRINARVAAGRFPDLWETPRALAYYDAAFREIAYECGFPVIPNDIDGFDGIIDRIVAEAARYSLYQSLALLNMDAAAVDALSRVDDVCAPARDPSPLTAELIRMVGGGCDDAVKLGHTRAWIADQIAARGTCDFATYPRFALVCEGESKRIYRIITDPRDGPNPYERLCIIVLKNTIYSHSKQSTGEIAGLGAVRAVGSRINVEIMRRCGIRHSYIAINKWGIIISEYLSQAEILPIEYVYKLSCLGTDKHAYYGMTKDRNVVNSDGTYTNGGYLRFDMRNPNHTVKLPDGCSAAVTESPCYYQIEEAIGKERFFELVLAQLAPWGDKTLPEPLAAQITDIAADRRVVRRLFKTLQDYYSKIGINILDACFMKTRNHVFWSEINPDCMRVVLLDAAATDLSKDIWRAGGSGAKDRIVEKWTLFNTLMGTWLQENPFDKCEMKNYSYYPAGSPFPQVGQRRVVVTLDLYDGKPTLVKRGLVTEYHSDDSVHTAMHKISIFPDILVVDLNGAIDDAITPTREIAKTLARKYYVHFGGGLRSIADVDEMLSASVRRVTIASATDLIPHIPRDRLIVELSIDADGYVMIDGRKTTTTEKAYERVKTLAALGVEAISVTFHQNEGMLRGLPRSQLSEFVLSVPPTIRKIMVAGGITTLDDLRFCWSLDRVIPQLGSAIWKGLLTPGDIYAEMCNYDNGLVKAAIQDTTGRVLGVINMDAEAIRRTANSRTLWRFSKGQNTLMQKGAMSDRILHVDKMVTDCEGNSLLITVGSPTPTFCHTGNYSCFSQQTITKTSLLVLADHLEARRRDGPAGSYSRRMMDAPAWALAKMFEELQEIVRAGPDTLMSECSDMLIHMLMFLNGRGVTLEDILNELNARRHAPRLIAAPIAAQRSAASPITILITASKYASLTDNFLEKYAGIRVSRGVGRSLKIIMKIVDPQLCVSVFGTMHVQLMGCRPKDMASTIARGLADGAITYNTVADNQPPVMQAAITTPCRGLRLCLIKRKDDPDPVFGGKPPRKIIIAAEHPVQVSAYLRSRGIPDNQFKIQPVLGSSESFLVNNSEYDLCDAVVETGKTLDENDLVVYEEVLADGAVTIGAYMAAK